MILARHRYVELLHRLMPRFIHLELFVKCNHADWRIRNKSPRRYLPTRQPVLSPIWNFKTFLLDNSLANTLIFIHLVRLGPPGIDFEVSILYDDLVHPVLLLLLLVLGFLCDHIVTRDEYSFESIRVSKSGMSCVNLTVEVNFAVILRSIARPFNYMLLLASLLSIWELEII